MTQEHPITPPPELTEKWATQFEEGRSLYVMFEDIYRAGADAELEACCKWLSDSANTGIDIHGTTAILYDLRAVRRPKPPNLKEQALALIDECTDPEGDYLDDNALSIIRRALEQLPDRELSGNSR